MAVRVSWTNKQEYASIRVYRSVNKIELDNLPPVHTEVAGSATFYVDISAKDNTIYNYRLGKVSLEDGKERFSQNYQFGNYPSTGHGWPTIIRGNWELGYYGSLTSTELFTPAELVSALNQRANGLYSGALYVYTQSAPDNQWHKFIHNGKILFIPSNPLGGDSLAYSNVSSIDWQLLYQLGAVYGHDDGYVPDGLTPVPQDLVVSKNGRNYKVRLPKLTNLDVSQPIWTNGIPSKQLDGYRGSEFVGSEVFQLLSALFTNRWLPEDAKRFANAKEIAAPTSRFWGDVLVQETTLSGDQSQSITVCNDTIYSDLLQYPNRTNFTVYGGTYSRVWWPVLELILD